jgi:hypothetical protein
MPLPREEYNALLALMTKEAVPMRALTPEQRQRYHILRQQFGPAIEPGPRLA